MPGKQQSIVKWAIAPTQPRSGSIPEAKKSVAKEVPYISVPVRSQTIEIISSESEESISEKESTPPPKTISDCVHFLFRADQSGGDLLKKSELESVNQKVEERELENDEVQEKKTADKSFSVCCLSSLCELEDVVKRKKYKNNILDERKAEKRARSQSGKRICKPGKESGMSWFYFVCEENCPDDCEDHYRTDIEMADATSEERRRVDYYRSQLKWRGSQECPIEYILDFERQVIPEFRFRNRA